MRAQWVGALIGAVVMLAVAVAVAALYLLYTKVPPAEVNNSVPPSTIQSMVLEAQFKGPLKDTVVQRWKDQATGTTCYIYLPVIVQHSPTTPTGFVQYGANGVGSISCLNSR